MPTNDLEKKRLYQKRWYEKHKATHLANVKKNKEGYYLLLRSNVLDYLRNHPCVDCGEGDPVVLEFDHVRGEKVNAVSKLVSRGCSWDTVLKEIEKCEVRCANCHRRKTAKQFGFYSLIA